MHVVFLIANIDTQTGGMERQALQLAQSLRKKGHGVFFISPTYNDVRRAQGLAWAGSIGGIPVFRIPFFKGQAILNACLYALFGAGLLIALRRRYSVIHAHQIYTSGAVAGMAALFLRDKTVVIKNGAGNVTGDIAVLRTIPGWKWMVRLINRCRATIVCVNEETMKESRKAGFARVISIPNGIDEQIFRPSSDNEKPGLRALLIERQPAGAMILFVGRLGPEKNVFTLIKALSLVRRDCFLSIVGDGVLKRQLADFAAQCGIRARVVFAGSRDDVARWYRAADVFVLPSYSEGMPNVLLEAMSSSLPVIASAIPSIREIVEDGRNGLLFPAQDAVALARCIERILEESEFSRRIAGAARRSIEDRFLFSRVALRYEAVYRQEGA